MLVALRGSTLRGRHQAILESALAAPRAAFARDPSLDPAALAAMYAAALARTHGFVPGSRRSAFLAAYVFLGLNGWDIDATEVEAAAVIEHLASRGMSEGEVAEWLRDVRK